MTQIIDSAEEVPDIDLDPDALELAPEGEEDAEPEEDDGGDSEDEGNDEGEGYEFDEEGEDEDDEPAETTAEPAPEPEAIVPPEVPATRQYEVPTVFHGWTVAPDGYSLSVDAFEDPDSESARFYRQSPIDAEGNEVFLLDEDGTKLTPWGEAKYNQYYAEYLADKREYEERRHQEDIALTNENAAALGKYADAIEAHFIKHDLSDLPPDIAKELYTPWRKKSADLLTEDRNAAIENLVKTGVRRDYASARVDASITANPTIALTYLGEAIKRDPQGAIKAIKDAVIKAQQAQAAPAKEAPEPAATPGGPRRASARPTPPPSTSGGAPPPREERSSARAESAREPAAVGGRVRATAEEIFAAKTLGYTGDDLNTFAGRISRRRGK